VQLEAQRANPLRELEFDEVMNVFGAGVVAHQSFACFRGVFGGNRIKRRAELRSFTFG
jgi:hypothetical protein